MSRCRRLWPCRARPHGTAPSRRREHPEVDAVVADFHDPRPPRWLNRRRRSWSAVRRTDSRNTMSPARAVHDRVVGELDHDLPAVAERHDGKRSALGVASPAARGRSPAARCGAGRRGDRPVDEGDDAVGKQSVVASARANGVPARRTATARAQGTKAGENGTGSGRIMATPREAERSRRIAGERVPENGERPTF